MTLFTLKYAPKNSTQVFGQQKGVSELKDFILNYKQKKQRAALLYGPIGNGKTSTVYALAHELNYDILEINSSDLRNEKGISSFLNSALGQQSLFFRPKLILIDEIDNVSGVKDRGAIPAIVKAITNSQFPVILTANDPFDSKFKSLRKSAQMIEFHKLQYRSVAHVLEWICQQENIQYEEKAINSLARQVDGDLRGALIDLHLCIKNNTFLFENLTILSDRKRTESVLNALTLIFKSSTIDNSLHALDNVDLDLREIIFWLDENLPKEYLDAKSLAKSYEHLARADQFNGRIRKRQHWRFLVYINNLLTAGISSAKEQKNNQFIQYKPTMRFLRMWQAKMKNAKKKDIAIKLALKTHTSKKVALTQIPYFQQIFKNSCQNANDINNNKNTHIILNISNELELTSDEIDWLKK